MKKILLARIGVERGKVVGGGKLPTLFQRIVVFLKLRLGACRAVNATLSIKCKVNSFHCDYVRCAILSKKLRARVQS